jgi:hypothetical protein
VVVLQSEPRVPRRSVLELLVAAVVVVSVVLGVSLIGRSTSDDDNGRVSAASAELASNSVAAEPAAATATDDGHAHGAGEGAAPPAVDDRGFAALENGEEHPHEFTQPVSPADRAELARQLMLARDVALQYPTVADAERAGLKRAGPFSPGLGAHYINFAGGLGNADGVMSDDDIRAPLAWIYDGTKPDSPVAGLFYQTGSAGAEGFAGPNDVWHVHHNVCIKFGPNGIDAPLGADRGATREQCDAVGGQLIEQTQYLLHVWVVPGYESPEGVFSHLSSAVTCDDGTYETIDDLTNVGSATSVCRDGTE